MDVAQTTDQPKPPIHGIFTNTFWLSLAQLNSMVLGLVTGIILARLFGVSDYGTYSFALSFVALFAIFIDFGFSMLLVNEISKRRDRLKVFLDNVVLLKLAFGLLSFLAIVMIMHLSGKTATVKNVVMVFGFSAILSGLSGTLITFFRAFEKMKYEALFKILGSLLTFGAVIVVFLKKLGVLNLVWLSVASDTVVLLIVVYFVRKMLYRFRIRFDPTFWKHALRTGLPLGVSTIFISLYYYVDQIMLGFMKNEQVVGWYGIDYRFIILFVTFLGLYYTAVFPVLSRLVISDLTATRHIINTSIKVILTITVPLAAGITMFSGKILNLLYGSQYLPGALALQILIWTIPLAAVSGAFGNLLLAKSDRVRYMLGVGLGAALNIALNFILIPRFSLNGAAVATVATEMLVLVYMAFTAHRKVVTFSVARYLVRPVVAAAIMTVALLPLRHVNVLLGALVGVIVYGISLAALRGVTKGDIALALNSFRGR